MSYLGLRIFRTRHKSHFGGKLLYFLEGKEPTRRVLADESTELAILLKQSEARLSI